MSGVMLLPEPCLPEVIFQDEVVILSRRASVFLNRKTYNGERSKMMCTLTRHIACSYHLPNSGITVIVVFYGLHANDHVGGTVACL